PQTFRLPVGAPSRPDGLDGDAADSAVTAVAERLVRGGAVALDAHRFDLRFQALTLARLEMEGPDWLNVTLLDEAYRPHVFRWLADHLDTSARTAGQTGGARFETASLPRQGDWVEWARTPHGELGGARPL